MDSTTSMKLCSLCFCFEHKFLKNIELTGKIEKYLQIKMEYSSNGICVNCYNSLETFHDFYERVRTAQENFRKNNVIKETDKQCKSNFEGNYIEQNFDEQKVEESNSQPENLTKFENGKTLEEQEHFNSEEKQSHNDKSVDLVMSEEESCKKSKQSKCKKVSSDIEKKMLEFYNIKCEKCKDSTFTSFKMLSKHYLTVHNTQGYIKCCKRNIRVNDKYYLRSHMFKHLQPDICRCRVCGKELSSLATLKHHMILHKPTEERPFQCGECGKRFCCKNDLKNHEKAIHLPENKREDYICDVCGKVFQKVANLRYHHSTIHLQERKYICEICAKCFTTQNGLRTHINAAHSSLDPIQCHECNKWLKTKDTFQKHLQLHQNNSYPCTHCDKVCNSSASLRSHLVKHSEERPYSCAVCKKSFKTKTHLKNHSTQHLGGSPYKCLYCSKLFVNMSNYYTHRRRMHSNVKSNKEDNKPSENIYQNTQEGDVGEENISEYKNTKNHSSYDPPFVGTVIRQNIIVSPIKQL